MNILVLLAIFLMAPEVLGADRHPSDHTPELPPFSGTEATPFQLPKLDEAIPGMNTGRVLIIKQVRFSPHRAISEQTLQAIAQPFLNRPIDAADLENLRFLISQHYLKQGYINSGALLPEQDLSDGILDIELIEGRLAELRFQGQGWLSEAYLKSRLTPDSPLNIQELQERYLLLLQDPLIERLNAELRPTERLGESRLAVKVTRARAYGLSVGFNNYRPPSVDAEQLTATGWLRNLTGWGDKFDFQFGISEGATTYAGGFALPLHPSGTLFEFHFNTGRSAVVEEPLAALDIESDVRNFNWTLSQPVFRTPDHTATLGLDFASRRTQTTLLDRSFSFNRGVDGGTTRVSVVRLFQEYLGRFQRHALAFRSTFNVGVDWFNATDVPSNDALDSEFFSWLGQLQYAYKLSDDGVLLKFRGAMQFSADPLLPQERIAVGGRYSVRGYRENELVRDNGYSGSLELYYPLIGQPGGPEQHLAIIPFMDYGSAWNLKEDSVSLHSVGIGLFWQPIPYLKGEFFWAHDLNQARPKAGHDLQDDGIHFSVNLGWF